MKEREKCFNHLETLQSLSAQEHRIEHFVFPGIHFYGVQGKTTQEHFDYFLTL